jgi:hypothetical protein
MDAVQENDPYAVSSDSEDDTKPPPMINIGVDLKVNNLVSSELFAIVLCV